MCVYEASKKKKRSRNGRSISDLFMLILISNWNTTKKGKRKIAFEFKAFVDKQRIVWQNK